MSRTLAPMSTQTTVVRVRRTRVEQEAALAAEAGGRPLAMLLAAPAVAIAAGLAAQWLDFRALRYPLLLLVGTGVLLTAIALARGARGWRPAAMTVVLGAATWGAAETLYVMIHAATGQQFDAPRFGSQPMQALGLIGVHTGVLGVPTGAAAAGLLHVPALFRRIRAR